MKIIAVLGYLLCFGIADCLWVYPNKKYPIIVSLTIRSIVTCTFFFALFFYTNHSLIELAHKKIDVAIAIGFSVISYGGLYFYVRSLKYVQVSVAAPVTTILTSILGVIFTVLFYHEVLTIKVASCLSTAFLGVILCFSKNYESRTWTGFNKGTFSCCLAALCWAISYTFFKTPINRLGVVTFSLILESTILIIDLILLFVNKQGSILASIKLDKPTLNLFLIGCLIFGGTLLNSYSFKLFPLMYLNILNKIGIVIPILWGAFLLKEKLSLLQLCGICILTTSAIIISI